MADCIRVSNLVLATQELVAERHPSFMARQLLQYSNSYNRDCDYYGNCSSWAGGRIAGLVVGIVCFALAIFFGVLACHIRRRRMAQVQGSLAFHHNKDNSSNFFIGTQFVVSSLLICIAGKRCLSSRHLPCAPCGSGLPLPKPGLPKPGLSKPGIPPG